MEPQELMSQNEKDLHEKFMRQALAMVSVFCSFGDIGVITSVVWDCQITSLDHAFLEEKKVLRFTDSYHRLRKPCRLMRHLSAVC